MANTILKDHRLIKVLVDHKKIDFVTVSKTKVVCTLSPKFYPADVDTLWHRTGQWPVTQKRNGKNYIIFDRFPGAGTMTMPPMLKNQPRA